MVILNSLHFKGFISQRGNRPAHRQRTGGGGGVRHLEFKCRPTDGIAVPARLVTGAGVDDQLYAAIFNGVGGMGLALGYFVDP